MAKDSHDSKTLALIEEPPKRGRPKLSALSRAEQTRENQRRYREKKKAMQSNLVNLSDLNALESVRNVPKMEIENLSDDDLQQFIVSATTLKTLGEYFLRMRNIVISDNVTEIKPKPRAPRKGAKPNESI